MTGRLRRWLGGSFEIQFRRADLLAVILFVVVVNAIWPGAPTWAFILLGAVVSVTDYAVRRFARWIGRRSTA